MFTAIKDYHSFLYVIYIQAHTSDIETSDKADFKELFNSYQSNSDLRYF